MTTVVRFYRASGAEIDGLITVAEEQINAALARDLPKEATVRSVQTALYRLEGHYHLMISLLIDAPDDVPRERLGFKLS